MLKYPMYVYVEALLWCFTWNKARVHAAEMLVKHEANLSALLASRPHAKCLVCVKHKQGNASTILKSFCFNINVYVGPGWS